jgi:hypothetical protein
MLFFLEETASRLRGEYSNKNLVTTFQCTRCARKYLKSM